MAILKYANQSGTVYAYEATYEWDPVRQQSRSKRKCIGKVDPETGEIIPTGTRKGASDARAGKGSAPSGGKELLEQISKLQGRLSAALSENGRLREENSRLKQFLVKTGREIEKMTNAEPPSVQGV